MNDSTVVTPLRREVGEMVFRQREEILVLDGKEQSRILMVTFRKLNLLVLRKRRRRTR